MPPGMTYMSAPQQGGHPQAFFQNGQLILRAPVAQDSQTPHLMFSPTGQPLQPQPPATVQVSVHQPLPPGLAASMQPMAMTTASGGTPRPPISLPNQPPIGKTQISRALPTLLPTTTTSTSMARPPTSNYVLGPGVQNPSPKSKQKMSPRTSSSGQVGRPPGHKSALNSLKMPPNMGTMSPPVLTGSPGLTPNSPLGPPVLHTSSPLMTAPQGLPHLQPPTLQPMMQPPPMSIANSSSNYVSKTNQPPSLLSSMAGQRIEAGNNKLPLMPAIKKNVEKLANNVQVQEPAQQQTNGQGLDTPKAVVKPNVLTHVIDGHIIQESSQPFPLDSDTKGRSNKRKSDPKTSSSHANNSSHSTSLVPSATTKGQSVSASNGTTTTTNTTTTSYSSTLANEKNKLETANSSEKKRGPGRPPGSTKQNIEHQRLMQQSNGDVSKVKDGPPAKKGKPSEDPIEILKSNNSNHSHPMMNVNMVTNNPLKWTVQQVCDFVKNLPGCSDYVEDFQLQEIDGQALMLLKSDHLMSAMAIKLGPALKICSAIDAMREELKQN